MATYTPISPIDNNVQERHPMYLQKAYLAQPAAYQECEPTYDQTEPTPATQGRNYNDAVVYPTDESQFHSNRTGLYDEQYTHRPDYPEYLGQASSYTRSLPVSQNGDVCNRCDYFSGYQKRLLCRF